MTKKPWTLAALMAFALIVGVMYGKSSGPATAVASIEDTLPDPPLLGETPTTIPVRTLEVATQDSVVVAENNGTVNVGGYHTHYKPNIPAAPPIVRIIERTRTVYVDKPVYVEKRVERPLRKVWTKPGVPARTRLGATLLTLRRFQDAGVDVGVIR